MYALKRTRSLGPGFTGTVQALLGQFRFYMTVSGLDAFAQCPEKKKSCGTKKFSGLKTNWQIILSILIGLICAKVSHFLIVKSKVDIIVHTKCVSLTDIRVFNSQNLIILLHVSFVMSIIFWRDGNVTMSISHSCCIYINITMFSPSGLNSEYLGFAITSIKWYQAFSLKPYHKLFHCLFSLIIFKL